MQTIHQAHLCFEIQQQAFTFDGEVPRSKHIKSQATANSAVTSEKKPDLEQTCRVITQKIIKEKIGLVNPTGGQECCIPCSIRGFNWLYFQKENPEPVDSIVPPASTWGTLTNRPDYYDQRGQTPPDLEYLTLDYPEQERQLPAAITIKVERDTAVENGCGHAVGWTQETVIDDSRHYTFKKTTSDIFQETLDRIPLKKWHNDALQAGLVNFFTQADPNKGHMVCFYIYKYGNRKPIKLLIDFQYQWVSPLSQLPNIVAKYEYNPIFNYWYNDPITPLLTTLSFSRLKTERTERDPLGLSSISVGAECFVISDDDNMVASTTTTTAATVPSISTEQAIQESSEDLPESTDTEEDVESSAEKQSRKRSKPVHKKNHTIPLTPEEEKAILKKPFKCTFEDCNSTFARKDNLTAHMRIHTGEKPFKCTVEGCDSAFAQKSSLTKHMRTHTGEKPFKCTVEGCDSAFAKKSTLTTHMKTHTGEKPFKCTVEGCDSAFAKKSTLTTHMKTHTGEKPFKCAVEGCDSAFAQKGDLTKHLRTHTGEKPFKCAVEGCISAFAQKGDLTMHMRTHTGEKPFKCTVEGCDSAFAKKSTLTTHMKTHTGEKPFKCAVEGCDSAFAQKSDLTMHMRTHTGEKPFKCAVEGCDSAFAQKSTLNMHLRTHTGEKPFKCTVEGCVSAFTQKGDLTKHLRTHTGEKPFKCTVEGCDSAFTVKSKLTRHMKTHEER